MRRLVHVSVANPDHASPFPYYRGKAQTEDVVRESGLSHAIVRPTLVFGPEDILVNNIAWGLRHVPVFLVPGDGRYEVQLVSVRDTAAICVEAGLAEGDVVLDAAGPSRWTFEAFVRLIARAVGSRAWIGRAPPEIALAASRVGGLRASATSCSRGTSWARSRPGSSFPTRSRADATASTSGSPRTHPGSAGGTRPSSRAISPMIVLASTSPQRRAILEQLRIPFEIVAPTYEEVGDDPVEHAVGKARSVDGGESLVLGVDTVVVLDGAVLGKPADAAEAQSMLERLSGRTHEVVSGICLRTAEWEEVGRAVTAVTFRQLTAPEIADYVASGEWEGRAGGYAIQGFGASLVERIEGDYLNVVGLPAALLLDALSRAPKTRG